MPKQQIDDAYLRDFFGIGDGPESEAELKEIRAKLERQQFQNGQDICVVDGPPDGMFFLESGSAVVLSREGEQINLLRAGQYFGEYAVLSGERRLSTVRSLGRTAVYRLGNEDMMEILRRHPGTYGELMRRVYGEVSRKHVMVTALSRMRRGILQDPGNKAPMRPKRMLLQYGALAVIFLLSALLVPRGTALPVFLLPLALMLAYVLVTRRTVESLVVGGMYAALLVYRSGLAVGYTDALLETMSDPDNAFTVLVMAMMGGVVTLIEASGAVTAFRKIVDRRVRSRPQTRFAMLWILLLTAIDEDLNLLCASTSVRTVADEQRAPREDAALMLSFLPTTTSSFVPFSLWGIFVVGTISVSAGGRSVGLFVDSIPFNFFSILAVAAMVAFCFGVLPKTRRLRGAERRVEEGGELWPEGSERFLIREEGEVWGKPINLLLPVLVLAAASLTLRSLHAGSLALDSACGLAATVVFLFFLYCAQGLMSPEQFLEHLLTGMQGMALPILLYLLSMCFSTLLEQAEMGAFFETAVSSLAFAAPLLPAILFLLGTLLTMALGSSWAMYAIGFPVALHAAQIMGLSVPLCIGAICAAGIAGEKNCVFTSEAMGVGTAVGCSPDAVLAVRMPYSAAFTLAALVLYAAAGFLL